MSVALAMAVIVFLAALAVLAAHKPARAAGVWVKDTMREDRLYFLTPKAVEGVSHRYADQWWIHLEGDSISVSVAEAKTVVEMIGGTWQEAAQ